jgi:hypothetical protein
MSAMVLAARLANTVVLIIAAPLTNIGVVTAVVIINCLQHPNALF